MRAVFVANVHLNTNEGIYKKILAEATALGKALGECDLVIGEHLKSGSIIINTQSREENKSSSSVLKTAVQVLNKQDCDCLYIRLMVPEPRLIELMRGAKRRGIKVFYEIPTYPYYAEQFRTSRKKYRAIAKITLDILFSPIIYRYCYKMPIIRSNSQIRMKDKMIEITNGVKTDNLRQKTYSSQRRDVFTMVTVGTLYPYHGYDRVLFGLRACNENINGIDVEFHVVGESPTINDLKKQAEDLDLQKVYFHGVKSTDELNEMYENFDVGLGCLALHRRNADIDTTLKIIEYYCRGVPAVTSGISPMDQYMPEATIHIADNNDPVSIKEIFEQYSKMPMDQKETISSIAREKFDWDWIMKSLKKTIE